MGRTSLVIIVVVLLLCGMLALGLKVQAQKALIEETVAVAYPYSSPSYSTSYRTGPEWDELNEFVTQGSDGWEGLEKLMSSADPVLAQQASLSLASGGLGSIDHFLRGLPTIDPSSKNYIGQEDFNDDVWQRVLKVIQDQDEELLEGAAYFLRIENGDLYRTSLNEGVIGSALVDSIPLASGVYAEVLPQTLAFYQPYDISGLTKLLKSRKEQDRLIAVRTLGKLGLEDTLPDVRRLKVDSSKSVRTAAITAESSIDTVVARRLAIASRSSSIVRSQPVDEREKMKKRLGMP